jgi:tetratricopeptide (TPR) repeat protein
MKSWSIYLALVTVFTLWPSNFHAAAQTSSDYDALVHQGNAQLQANNNDLALTAASSAIKLDADRWEAYALAGGALMNLKRYEEAADDFSKAIDHASEAKQQGLRDLRKQCFAAESGNPRSLSTPSTTATNASSPEATTTQAEIVLWKSIENSTHPDDFNAYLKQYPNGAFAVLARQHLDEALDSQATIFKNLMSACQTSVMQAGSQNATITIRDPKESNALANANKIKDPVQRLQALREFLVRYPNSVVRETLLESLVAQELNSKSYDVALTDDESILNLDPSNHRALLVAGFLYNAKSSTESDPAKKQNLQSQAFTLLRRCAPGGN